ncbi:MAG: DDE-type integrase/transposase/recombinase [Candidatus Methanofastidiosia archaeon]
MVKLTNKQIKYIVNQVVKHKKSTKAMARLYGVSQRRVQQVVKIYKETGEYPELNPNRRPKRHVTEEEKNIIEEAYKNSYLGARMLRYHIVKHYDVSIPHNKIHAYLKVKGYLHPDPKKQKKRKRCRYERKHSLSLIHADWFEYHGKKIIAFQDDASRCILAIREFKHATGMNTIKILKEASRVAESVNGVILAINTDRGSQFYANKKDKKGKGTQFQKYLERIGIKHIPSRRNNPQTNGKLERWGREYKRHRDKFETAEEFAIWYNNRIHGALNLEIGETPQEAFMRKLRPQCLCGMFWKRIER